MKPQTVRVIFRVWKTEPKETLAVFIDEPFSSTCDVTCYEHFGQHGGGDWGTIVSKTRPANEEESAPLRRELESIGYNLQEVKRYTRKR